MATASRLRLLVATGNAGKLKEFARMLKEFPVDVVAPVDVGGIPDVVEDCDSFSGNAEKKAREIGAAKQMVVLADDSGLEVDCLGGKPGVHSARFSGPSATSESNNQKLLEALNGRPVPWTARFRCVLCFFDANTGAFFSTSGVCEGAIIAEPRGTGGFGYDPMFVPVGLDRSMAELTPDEKAALSHRGAATRAMVSVLRTHLDDVLAGVARNG